MFQAKAEGVRKIVECSADIRGILHSANPCGYWIIYPEMFIFIFFLSEFEYIRKQFIG